jgi:MurNAc alpha-1-phosphate uridylyltransferase
MSEPLLPVCILAGGLATRLGAHARSSPKALMEVAGQPFVFHQLELLRGFGARRFVICVGHLGEQIEEVVGDGSELGVSVGYAYDGPTPVGTAGAVRGALQQLGDAFFVLYGDTYLRVDYRAVQDTFVSSGLPALMTVLRNEGGLDHVSNSAFDGRRVVSHDKRNPTEAMRWIDYGVSVLTSEAMGSAPEASDLSDVYGELAREGRLAGYEATERFYEIGTPEALAGTDAFLRKHLRRDPPSA